jgi:hypothetical protein
VDRKLLQDERLHRDLWEVSGCLNVIGGYVDPPRVGSRAYNIKDDCFYTIVLVSKAKRTQEHKAWVVKDGDTKAIEASIAELIVIGDLPFVAADFNVNYEKIVSFFVEILVQSSLEFSETEQYERKQTDEVSDAKDSAIQKELTAISGSIAQKPHPYTAASLVNLVISVLRGKCAATLFATMRSPVILKQVAAAPSHHFTLLLDLAKRSKSTLTTGKREPERAQVILESAFRLVPLSPIAGLLTKTERESPQH